LHWLLVRAKQYPKLFLDTGPYILDPDADPDRQARASSRLLPFFIKAIFVAGNVLAIGLAALGIFFERARLLSLSHIMLFPLYISVIHLPLWIEPRYSLPVMPLVAILAAVGALRLAGKPVYEDNWPGKA
jgi:hypothetical protein